MIGTAPVVETEVVPLTANLEKAREEAVNARAELTKLRVAAESVAGEHEAMLNKMPEERQGELESLNATASQHEATIANVRDETSPKVTRARSERDSVAARLHEVMVSIRRIVERREKRKEKRAETLPELHKV